MALSSPTIIWLFGHQVSSGTTLISTLCNVLRAEKRTVCVLDEATFRSGVSQDLGSSREDTLRHLQRVAHTASLLAKQEQLVITIVPLADKSSVNAVREILGDSLLLVSLESDANSTAQLLDEVTGLTRLPAADRETAAPSDLTLDITKLNVSECVRRLRERLIAPSDETTASKTMPVVRKADDVQSDPTRVRRARTVDEVRDRHLRQIGILAAASVVVFTVVFLFLRDFKSESRSNPSKEAEAKTNVTVALRPVLKAPEANKEPNHQAPLFQPETKQSKAEDSVQSIPEIKASCEATMAAFWKASTWQDKLRFVRSPDRASKLMKDYYEVHQHIEPAAGALLSASVDKVGATQLATLNYAGVGSGKKVLVVLVKNAEGKFLLDWEHYTGSGDMDWEDFKKQRPTAPQLFRGYLVEDSYFNYEFTDEARYISYRIESADGLQSINAFCEKGSEIADRLYGLSQRTGGQKNPVAVNLAYPDQAKSDHCVKLTALVADRWLVLD